MRRLTLTLVPLLLFACNRESMAPTPPLFSARGNAVVHQVSVGGPDLSGPGADNSLALVAVEYADGSVSGHAADYWLKGWGNTGIQVAVNCLNIIGNEAWVSGVVTKGQFRDFFGPGLPLDYSGRLVDIRVQDNGTSAQDPPDALSTWFIHFPEWEAPNVSPFGVSWPHVGDCHDAPLYTEMFPWGEEPFVLVDLRQGQVTIR